MKKRTMFFMWLVIILFIMILIPYVQNAADGPTTPGISFFMGYYIVNNFPPVYLYIVTMGIVRGALVTLFVQSRLNDIKGDEPNKFDLNP